MFAQRSLQPRLSRRRYGDVPFARVNRNVFSLVQNCVRVSDESRTVSGRESHNVMVQRHRSSFVRILPDYTVRPQNLRVLLTVNHVAAELLKLVTERRPTYKGRKGRGPTSTGNGSRARKGRREGTERKGKGIPPSPKVIVSRINTARHDHKPKIYTNMGKGSLRKQCFCIETA